MDLAVLPPVKPMLATLARELPMGDYSYEPKWDGFRCLAFRHGSEVDLRSRNGSPFSRYFPELVAAFEALPAPPCVIDGEILVTTNGHFNFDALLKRIHPAASHVTAMAESAPASFVAFDVLAIGNTTLTPSPFVDRRRRLEAVMATAGPPLFVTPLTDDVDVARRWLEQPAEAVDGVVAKHHDSPYLSGKRAMVKVKPLHTADCVVAGCRIAADRSGVSSLLLGLYGDEGLLHHVGVVAGFGKDRRIELVEAVRPHVVDLADHPWHGGFALEGGSMGRLAGSAGRWTPDMPLDWVPLRPELVCETTYDQVDGLRWRHPGRFVRWRPDREAASCRIDQLVVKDRPLPLTATT